VNPAGLVLAAGRGERLRPLTDATPKPLLAVGGRTLLDLALDRIGQVLPVDPGTVAVNAHWLSDQIAAAVAGRATVSIETPEPLGTAGAVGKLRDWLAGRDVLIANADAWYDEPPDVQDFVSGWHGERPRLLVVEDTDHPDFEGPGALARLLEPVPSGLYEAVWSRADLDLVPTDVTFVDAGTPEELARARTIASQQWGPA
jgi:NDP-sugar pyrophosphorylase family protein